ncbi:hypothetical protein VNO78_22958 [Psophocarpus tetragonolobus]|uniref:Uncharacterized protein n=1 Tax=Psophocarpus tetragonolobus TaxID=3891 RepID=A0AAN9S404_PSOTE
MVVRSAIDDQKLFVVSGEIVYARLKSAMEGQLEEGKYMVLKSTAITTLVLETSMTSFEVKILMIALKPIFEGVMGELAQVGSRKGDSEIGQRTRALGVGARVGESGMDGGGELLCSVKEVVASCSCEVAGMNPLVGFELRCVSFLWRRVVQI